MRTPSGNPFVKKIKIIMVMYLKRFFHFSFFRKKYRNILVKNHKNGEIRNARILERIKNIEEHYSSS
jgi:hypothetical protein